MSYTIVRRDRPLPVTNPLSCLKDLKVTELRRMQIVLIIHHTLTRNAGAPGVVSALAREFASQGHSVNVISHDSLPQLSGRLRAVLFPFYCAWTLWRHHRSADVIDASSGTAWIYFRLARHKGRGLYVSHSHGLAHVIHDHLMKEVAAGRQTVSWKYPLFNGSFVLWQDAETYRGADVALFLNQSDRTYAIDRLRVPADRAITVRNGLSRSYLESAQRLLNRPPRARRRIVQVGSYIERKGIATTAAALTQLMIDRPDVELTFLGTTRPQSETLADFPPELRSRVHPIPLFDNEELPELLSRQDVFIMPSLSEGFPLAPMEAMACGIVPVVTDIPGPTEYISDRKNGLLIPVGNPEALRAAIIELLDNDELYQQLKANAIETAFGLEWSEIARSRLGVYRLFLDSRKKSDISRNT